MFIQTLYKLEKGELKTCRAARNQVKSMEKAGWSTVIPKEEVKLETKVEEKKEKTVNKEKSKELK